MNMIDFEDVKEFGKEIVSKALTVGLTVFMSNNGVDLMLNYIWAPAPESMLAFKTLSVVVAYGVWTKAIVPLFIKLIQPKMTAGKVSNRTKNRFDLI